jgi:multiple sugar transport system substrate-binding protein
MKKKMLLSLVAAAATAMVLSSCSTAETGSDAGGGGAAITFAYWGNNQENATIKAMIADFEKANPDIKVQGNWIQSDYEQKLQTEIAGGQPPTVSEISNTSLAGFAKSYQPVDVTPSDYYSANIPGSMKIDGKYYAVPFVAKTKVTAINAKLFAAAGIPLPSTSTPMTPDEYIATAKKLTTGSGSTKQFGSAPLWYNGWLNVHGNTFFSADGTRCTVGDPSAVTAANEVIEAQSDDGFTPTLLDAQGQDMFDWLSIGRIGMQIDFGPWNIAQLLALKNASDFRIVPDPGNGEPIEIDGLGISTSADKATTAAAKKFADFMSTDKGAQERLTTKASSLGVPVVQSAVDSFEATAPDLDLKAFVTAVSQSKVPASVKQYNQAQTDFWNNLSAQTAIGSGKQDPATVLPKLQKACQATLSSGD